MEYGVEKLIYLYIAICAALILFNFVCIFYFGIVNYRIGKKSVYLERYPGKKALKRIFRKENNALSLELTLDRLKQDNPEEFSKYTDSLREIIGSWIRTNRIRDRLYKAYLYYFAAKYALFKGNGEKKLTDVLVKDAWNSDLYLRENSLRLIYSIGDAQTVLDALRAVDREQIPHNAKLLHDGLLDYSGDKESLWGKIWESFEEFSPGMQLVFLEYFRYSTGKFCEKYLSILMDPNRDHELHYSCLRYFRRYPYAPALPRILAYAGGSMGEIWEYAAVAANTLEAYPGKESFEVLCRMLSSENWHIRVNAAKALVNQGYVYSDFDFILDGDDRFAREALQYQLDRKAASAPEGGAA